jgi:Lhr-like helicase
MSKQKVNQEYLNIDLRGKRYDIDEVRALRRKLAKRANARLLSLERKGLTKNAYRVATRYTQATRGRNRFSEAYLKSAEISYLREDIENLRVFLNSVTSTVSGYKQLKKERISRFRQNGLKIDDEDQFYRFLNSKIYKDLANKLISSDKLIEFYDDVVDSGKYEMKDLKEALEEFKKGDVESIDDLYEMFNLKFLGD